MWGNFILVVVVFGLCKDLSFRSILGRCDNMQVETLVCSFPCSPTTTRRQMLGDSTRFSSQQTWSRLRTQLRAARGEAFAPTHTAQTMPPRRLWRAPRRWCTALGQRGVVVQGKGCDVPSSSSVSRLCPQAHNCTLWSKAWGLIIFFVPVFFASLCSFAFFLLQTL